MLTEVLESGLRKAPLLSLPKALQLQSLMKQLFRMPVLEESPQLKLPLSYPIKHSQMEQFFVTQLHPLHRRDKESQDEPAQRQLPPRGLIVIRFQQWLFPPHSLQSQNQDELAFHQQL